MDLIAGYLKGLLAVAITVVVVGLLQVVAPDLDTTILLYLVPIIFTASRWGRGPAIVAALASALMHNLLFVEPIWTLVVNRPSDALAIVLLLFTALVTA